MTKNNLIKGMSALLGSALLLAIGARFLPLSQALEKALILGSFTAGLNSVLSLALLTWSYSKSTQVFLGSYIGSIFWKLLVLAAFVLLLRGNAAIELPAALISLALCGLAFNILELRYLPNQA